MREQTLNNCNGEYQKILNACVCLHTKMASRTLTNLYDKHLAEISINSGQFSILTKIALIGSPTLNILAEELNLKSSTISRALAPLERDNFITMTPGSDKRTRCVSLTQKGEQTIQKGMKGWHNAQEKLLSKLDPTEVAQLISALQKLTELHY